MVVTKLIVETQYAKCCQEDYAAPHIMKRNCSLWMLILEIILHFHYLKFIKLVFSFFLSFFLKLLRIKLFLNKFFSSG